MYITLLCVGKIKEKYWQQAIDEYAKRISKYHQFKILSVADEKDPAQESEKAITALKDREAERLLKHIRDEDFVITLEIEGIAGRAPDAPTLSSSSAAVTAWAVPSLPAATFPCPFRS